MSAWPEAIHIIKKIKSDLFNTYTSLRGSNSAVNLTSLQNNAAIIQSSITTIIQGSGSTVVTLPTLNEQMAARTTQIIGVIGTTSNTTVKTRFDNLDSSIVSLNTTVTNMNTSIAAAIQSRHYAIIDQSSDLTTFPPVNEFISGAICFIRT